MTYFDSDGLKIDMIDKAHAGWLDKLKIMYRLLRANRFVLMTVKINSAADSIIVDANVMRYRLSNKGMCDLMATTVIEISRYESAGEKLKENLK